jgi:DNA-binding transcriptional ArsR family regulator
MRISVSSPHSKDQAKLTKLQVSKAMSLPLRHRVLVILREREASPKEISEDLDEALGKVAYHVRKLANAGLIELVDTDRRRGGTQHFYKAVVDTFIDTEAAEALSLTEREVGSRETIRSILADVDAAIQEKTFDSHVARTLLRQLLILDEQGMKRTAELSVQFLEDLRQVEVESTERLVETGSQEMRVSSATLVFPLPPRRGTLNRPTG